MEPNQLKRGKLFQALVQRDYIKNTQDGVMQKEVTVDYGLNSRKTKRKYGRMDMYLDDRESGFVVIYEIKATDWDNIKPKNIVRNLYRHGRQLHKYIDVFLKDPNIHVVHGVLYPHPPKTAGLRKLIEELAMNRYAFPVYWYSELTEK
jgi:hypothetical protein